ncbi:hypothetical protein PC128_g25265 [Phytophthora cactorum]|nr:hypothetical protein PC120_g24704 [Phytophthora cactorum]KAG3043091.1 hypothetical protein PC121_g22764 [Phytophthora cactorum]KAG3140069.1 hypothetical protein PC128_g25265 [Phytophthora cactorum]KAG4039221.1 hypothetical protein PC123_g25225 [Phytophthora cactorum]
MPRSVKMTPDAPGVTVKAADGRELTLRRGLTFLDRPTATAFFQDFAKAQGKRLIINKKKSGGAQYEYVCASRAPPCQFRIKLLKSRSAQSSHFFVSSFIAQHAPDCAGAPKLTVRQAAAVLLGDAEGASSTAAAATVSSVKELQERLQQSSGETISARKAYRVRDRILRLAAGQFTKGFQKLESLLQGFQSKNHGAHVAFEVDQTSGMFKRAFLAHPFVAVYQQSRGLQPMLGLDTASLVSMNYRGQMFVLQGKDGNNEVIPLCVAVAPQADADNWRWFLMNCQQAQVHFSRSIVVADRTRGLVAATEGLRLPLRQCTRHIISNLKIMVKNLATVQVEDLVWRAQAADSEAEFNSCLSMIGLTCPAAENYLRGLDPCTWTLFCAAQQLKLYGWNSTLFSVDDNKSLLSLAPYDFMQHYMEKFMTLAYNQGVYAKKWVKEGKVFTEYADKLLAEQREAANFQVVQPSDDGVIFVTESRSFPPRRYRVDLNQRVCSCAYLFQMGVPCRHFLAGLTFFKRSKEEADYVDTCYRVSTFAEQYDNQRTRSIELLLDAEVEENHAVKAPAVARKRGRPKSKPFPAGESLMTPAVASALLNGDTNLLLDSDDTSSKRRCSTCGKTGHSKHTCEQNAPVPVPVPLASEVAAPNMMV